MRRFNSADIVRLNDRGYPGLYEVVDVCDASTDPNSFDFDYYVTNDECETEMRVIHRDLILVVKAEYRSDVNESYSEEASE